MGCFVRSNTQCRERYAVVEEDVSMLSPIMAVCMCPITRNYAIRSHLLVHARRLLACICVASVHRTLNVWKTATKNYRAIISINISSVKCVHETNNSRYLGSPISTISIFQELLFFKLCRRCRHRPIICAQFIRLCAAEPQFHRFLCHSSHCIRAHRNSCALCVSQLNR